MSDLTAIFIATEDVRIRYRQGEICKQRHDYECKQLYNQLERLKRGVEHG